MKLSESARVLGAGFAKGRVAFNEGGEHTQSVAERHV